MAPVQQPVTEAGAPPEEALDEVRERARRCHACPLWANATQTVFGAGHERARVVLVGEQPGDREDLEGDPFVGPAGRLLDKALEEAGVDRAGVFVTNVVKHFKFERKGKRRIHRKPNAEEIGACKPWLEYEIAHIQPEIVVALGATAAQSLLGKQFRVTKQRGTPIEWDGRRVVATVHPSSILRAPDDQTRHAEQAAFVEDLRRVAALLQDGAG